MVEINIRPCNLGPPTHTRIHGRRVTIVTTVVLYIANSGQQAKPKCMVEYHVTNCGPQGLPYYMAKLTQYITNCGAQTIPNIW